MLLKPDALDGARRVPEENTGYVVWGEYARILGGYLDDLWHVGPVERKHHEAWYLAL